MTTKPILFLRWKEGWFQTRIMVLPFLHPPPPSPFVFACGSGCVGGRAATTTVFGKQELAFPLLAPPPATPRPSFLPPSSSSFPCTFLSCSGIPSRRSVGRRGASLPPAKLDSPGGSNLLHNRDSSSRRSQSYFCRIWMKKVGLGAGRGSEEEEKKVTWQKAQNRYR